MPFTARVVDRLRDLADVNFAPGAGVDGYAMVYDHASGKVVPAASVPNAGLLDGLDSTAFALASHTHPLSALTQSGATTGQFAQWSGSAWVPATVSTSFALDDATDVAITTPAARHGLMYSGTGWVNRVLVEADISNLQSYALASHSHAHSAITSPTVGDDHTQYALLAGRAGGQTLIGGTASGNALTLTSTSHATKGVVDASSSTQVLIPDGTSALPGWAFGADTDTGMARSGANSVRVYAGASQVWSWGTGRVDMAASTALYTANGSVGAPAIAYVGASNYGLYWPSASSVAMSAGGVQAMLWQAVSPNVTITAQGAAHIPLAIQLAPSHSANAFNVTSSGGAAGDIFKVSAAGAVTAPSCVFTSGSLGSLSFSGIAISAGGGGGQFKDASANVRFAWNGTGVGFFNVGPVARQALIADPTGGATVDAESRTAIAAINALLKAYGLEATS